MEHPDPPPPLPTKNKEPRARLAYKRTLGLALFEAASTGHNMRTGSEWATRVAIRSGIFQGIRSEADCTDMVQIDTDVCNRFRVSHGLPPSTSTYGPRSHSPVATLGCT